MLWCFWTAKGGAGCSVVAAAVAMRTATKRDTLLVDLGGDVATIYGVEPPGLGMLEWLMEPEAPPDALSRIEVAVAPGLQLLSMSSQAAHILPSSEVVGSQTVDSPDLLTPDGPPLPGPSFKTASRVRVLASLLQADHRVVVVDVGLRSVDVSSPRSEISDLLLAQAQRSTLVTRSCFVALRRTAAFEQPSDVVAIFEKGRALSRGDIERAVNAPVVSAIRWDPAVARAVDVGVTATQLPRSLADLPQADFSEDQPRLELGGFAWPS